MKMHCNQRLSDPCSIYVYLLLIFEFESVNGGTSSQQSCELLKICLSCTCRFVQYCQTIILNRPYYCLNVKSSRFSSVIIKIIQVVEIASSATVACKRNHQTSLVAEFSAYTYTVGLTAMSLEINIVKIYRFIS